MTVAISNMTVTWNSGATVFTAIKMNITDTASAADSKLLDLQVASSSKIWIEKTGYFLSAAIPNAPASTADVSTMAPNSGVGWMFGRSGVQARAVHAGCTTSSNLPVLVVANNGVIGFGQFNNVYGNTECDTSFARNAAGLMEVNNGTPGTLRDLTLRDIFTNDASFLHRTKTTITGGSTGNVPTLSAGPVTGNPTKWLGIDDNGTTRYVPAW